MAIRCQSALSKMNNASLALEVSLQAVEQALAVVEANTAALEAAVQEYNICMLKNPPVEESFAASEPVMSAKDIASMKVSVDLAKTALRRIRQVTK